MGESRNKLERIRADILELTEAERPRTDLMARRRWTLAQIVYQQLAKEERELFSALGQDPRPTAVARLSKRRRQAERFYDLLQRHVEGWEVDRIAAEWPRYTCLVRQTILPALNAWLDADEPQAEGPTAAKIGAL